MSLTRCFILDLPTGCGTGGRCNWMHFDRLFTWLPSCGIQASGVNKHHFSSALTEKQHALIKSSGLSVFILRISNIVISFVPSHHCRWKATLYPFHTWKQSFDKLHKIRFVLSVAWKYSGFLFWCWFQLLVLGMPLSAVHTWKHKITPPILLFSTRLD